MCQTKQAMLSADGKIVIINFRFSKIVLKFEIRESSSKLIIFSTTYIPYSKFPLRRKPIVTLHAKYDVNLMPSANVFYREVESFPVTIHYTPIDNIWMCVGSLLAVFAFIRNINALFELNIGKGP